MKAMTAIAARKEKGFTLIELVMVIVILGILAAFALPRFADLGEDARESSLQGLAGAIKSAASIAHSAQLAGGSALGASVELESADITMVNGYPTADSDGIVAAANIDSNDYAPSGGGSAGGDTITFTLQANCTVQYQAATNSGSDNTAGSVDAIYSVTVTDSGC